MKDWVGILGITAGIVLCALDKAGKLKGPLPVWLIAALTTLPWAFGNGWVAGSSTLPIRIVRCAICVMGSAFSFLLLIHWMLVQD